MRIIAGEYRGRILKSPPSMQIRPTSDRLRETLFNVIAAHVEGARVLDLCAGTGAIGIEALSRGAEFVTFVDRSRKMCGLIEANLDLCRAPEEQTEVVLSDAAEFVRRAGRQKENGTDDAEEAKSWNIVFYDPPYSDDYAPTMDALGASPLLRENGIVVAEHHHKHPPRDEYGALRRWRILRQGDSALSFYERV